MHRPLTPESSKHRVVELMKIDQRSAWVECIDRHDLERFSQIIVRRIYHLSSLLVQGAKLIAKRKPVRERLGAVERKPVPEYRALPVIGQGPAATPWQCHYQVL